MLGIFNEVSSDSTFSKIIWRSRVLKFENSSPSLLFNRWYKGVFGTFLLNCQQLLKRDDDMSNGNIPL